MSGLAGRRVLLTREEEDCAAWAAEIEGLGAVPVIFPCIECRGIDTPDLRARLAAELPRARWLAFTSRRGVAAFAGLRGGAGPGTRSKAGQAPGPEPVSRPNPGLTPGSGSGPGSVPGPARAALPDGLRVAAVGPATARAAANALGRVDLAGAAGSPGGSGDPGGPGSFDADRDAGTAAALAQALAPRLGPRDRVLLAAAENAGDAFEKAIRAAGRACVRLDVYRTLPVPEPPRKRAVSDLGADAVLLASPSAVTGFVNQVRLDRAPGIFTIGPTTTEAARAAGLEAAGEARCPSLRGLLEAMRCAT